MRDVDRRTAMTIPNLACRFLSHVSQNADLEMILRDVLFLQDNCRFPPTAIAGKTGVI